MTTKFSNGVKQKTNPLLIFIVLTVIIIASVVANLFFVSFPTRIFSAVVSTGAALALTIIYIKPANKTSEEPFEKKELVAVIENLQDGFIAYDSLFTILAFNPAAEKIFKIRAQDVLGKRIDPKFSNDPKFKILTQIIFPSLASSLVQISEANAWPQVVDIFTEDPTLKLRTVLNRFQIGNGPSLYFFKLVHDETRESAVLKSKNEFINTAAHQLRTPLTAINWALENIIKISEGNSPEINETAKETFRVSERTLKITNDLLDVAKMDEGHFGYEFQNVDFVSFVEEIIKASLPIARQYSVKLSYSPPAEKINLRIDTERIGLALFNIIDNAIKYNTKNGSVAVSIKKNQKRDYVKISVEDSGVGIPKEDIEKVFTKFHRSANAKQLEPNGSGLGLFIARNIIKRHGGEIGVESSIDRGSTFWFTLPTDPMAIPERELIYDEV